MNFTYKLTQSPNQIQRSDNAIIPNTQNSDWQLYQNWLAQGNIPSPIDPLPPKTPDWDDLHRKLSTGVLKPIAKGALRANVLASTSMVSLLFLIAVPNPNRTEQDLKDALDEVIANGYIFTLTNKNLWNSEIAKSYFSTLARVP